MHSLPHNIVILTGAGVSAESGIPTFRGSDGLWENHRIEDVATPEGFARDPELVRRFYNIRRAVLRDPAIQPNAAHSALAQLQQHHKGSVTLITQNIDDLHERAGFREVIHMHGELLKVRCVNTGHVYDWSGDIERDSRCGCCLSGQALRPDVVWFGEVPFHLDRIQQALSEADLFVAIGTSGNVYPAAGFVAEAKALHVRTLEINIEPSRNRFLFDDGLYGPASVKVPLWVEGILNET